MLLKKERKKEIITTEGSGDEKQMEQKQKGEGSRRPISAMLALPSLPWMGGWPGGKRKNNPSHPCLRFQFWQEYRLLTTDAVKLSSRTMSNVHSEQREKSDAPHELACLSTQKQFSSSFIKFSSRFINHSISQAPAKLDVNNNNAKATGRIIPVTSRSSKIELKWLSTHYLLKNHCSYTI